MMEILQVNMIKQGVSEKNQETENTNDYFVSIEVCTQPIATNHTIHSQ